MTKNLCVLTFDIEDWYNHDDYSRDFNWDKHEVRIYEGVDKILSSLNDYQLKATFFCLGWIAEKHPDIIRRISNNGHHIGCHSYQHELATRFTKEEFRDDTYKAKALIEDVSGCKVDAFRVPSFSITKNNLWAFDVLSELGFKYDGSVFPSQHEFGGLPDYPSSPFLIKTVHGDIKEFPISIGHMCNREIVYSGGGYFRVLPYRLIKQMTESEPYVMAYFHPSDFDPKQPHMSHLPLMRQIKNRIGLKGSYQKYLKYVSNNDFISIKEADSQIDWSRVREINIDEYGTV